MPIRSVNFGRSRSGLSTVGYRLRASDGTLGGRVTEGITESPVASGIYIADVTTTTEVEIAWDTGEATPRYAAESIVTAATPTQIVDAWRSVHPPQGDGDRTNDEIMGLLAERLPETGTLATMGDVGGLTTEQEAKIDDIMAALQTDPPIVGGALQFQNRKIVRGDTYGAGGRDLSVTRHRAAEWPTDLSGWTWTFTSSLAPENTNSGDALTGTVSVSVATGEARSLTVALNSTSTTAVGQHVYRVSGTKSGNRWTVELGQITVIADPS